MWFLAGAKAGKKIVQNRWFKIILGVLFFLLVVPFLVSRIWRKFKEMKPPAGIAEDAPTEGNISYSDVARALSIHLGTNKDLSWWSGWGENDVDVYNILRPLTRSQFNEVARLYARDYTSNRDLAGDVINLLDEEYYYKLTHLFDVVPGSVGSEYSKK